MLFYSAFKLLHRTKTSYSATANETMLPITVAFKWALKCEDNIQMDVMEVGFVDVN
jgi:hypothetical protein